MLKLLLLLSYVLVSLSYLNYQRFLSCCRDIDKFSITKILASLTIRGDIDNNDNNDNIKRSIDIVKKKKKSRQLIGYTNIRNVTITNVTTVDSINIGNMMSNYNISFTVYGEPTPLSRHMLSKGRMYNPSGMHQREFAKACESFLPSKPLEGPIEAKMIFYFSRPKYHFRTGKNSHLLKDGISDWHSTRKDLDNLIKFVLDSLNKQAYLDDSQVKNLLKHKLLC